MTSKHSTIGVAIVAFNSADVIVDCLDSLFASQGADVRVVIADNSSTDATCDIIQQWAEARGQGFSWQMANAGALDRASASLTLIKSAVNGGYAHGVNLALSVRDKRRLCPTSASSTRTTWYGSVKAGRKRSMTTS